jgi:hypothetical protein
VRACGSPDVSLLHKSVAHGRDPDIDLAQGSRLALRQSILTDARLISPQIVPALSRELCHAVL